MALEGLCDAVALRYTMPFLLAAHEEQREVFGPDPRPYRVEPNPKTLEHFLQLLGEQGLLDERPITVDDLFARSTTDEPRI